MSLAESTGLGGHFHVGIIVRDLEAACAHFTDLLGCSWGPIVEHEIAFRDADGNQRSAPNRVCFSTEPPHLELIQEAPGTPWVCNEHSNLHHIGFFTGTVSTGSDRLVAAMCPLEAMAPDADAPTGWAYHRDDLAVRIELVNAQMRETLERFMFRAVGGDS